MNPTLCDFFLDQILNGIREYSNFQISDDLRIILVKYKNDSSYFKILRTAIQYGRLELIKKMILPYKDDGIELLLTTFILVAIETSITYDQWEILQWLISPLENDGQGLTLKDKHLFNLATKKFEIVEKLIQKLLETNHLQEVYSLIKSILDNPNIDEKKKCCVRFYLVNMIFLDQLKIDSQQVASFPEPNTQFLTREDEILKAVQMYRFLANAEQDPFLLGMKKQADNLLKSNPNDELWYLESYVAFCDYYRKTPPDKRPVDSECFAHYEQMAANFNLPLHLKNQSVIRQPGHAI